MAKKTKKQTPNPGKKTPAPPVAQDPPATGPLDVFLANHRLQSILVFAIAFLLYANTLNHGFVLDDSIVITENMFTEKGIEGIPGILSKDTFFGYFKTEGKENLVSGGRYRPLSLVFFAVLFEIFGKSPFVFHLFTVLLFATTCLVLYHCLRYLFSPRMGNRYANAVAWMAALLFAAHPIHTEVVANIKGSDEILTLLACLGAMWLFLRARDGQSWPLAALAGAVFLAACMSKENAVVFLVLIPLAAYYFRPAEGRPALPQILAYSLPLLLGFLVFFVVRGSILNWKFGAAPMELMNNPFLKIEGNQWVKFTASEKLATIAYTLGKYIQLFVWPHPLTHDYYPKQIPIKRFGDPAVLLSLAMYLFMAFYALRTLLKRQAAGFGIWVYLLSLSIVSNIVFPVGTFMGERFVFMPSVGVCMVAAHFLYQTGRRGLTTPVAATAVIALILGGLTLLRNPAWESNEKLFFTDVKNSPNSAKINNACGGARFEQALAEKDEAKRQKLFEEAFAYANKAVELYPNYKDALISRAGAQYYLKNYEGAVNDYRLAARIAQKDPKPKSYLAIALRDAGQYYGEQRGDLEKAIQYLEESWSLNDQDAATARLLGVANGFSGEMALRAGKTAETVQARQKALTWFERAAALAPNDASILFDLGSAYYLVGRAEEGARWHAKAEQIDPEIRQRKNAGR